MTSMRGLQALFKTAQLSFQEGHSGQGQNDQPQDPLSFDDIFPTHGHTYYFMTRAFAFGVMMNEIDEVKNVHVDAIQYADTDAPIQQSRVFDCAIIEMNLTAEDVDGDFDRKFIHIYKNTSTGLYTIGRLINGVLLIDDKIINQSIDIDATKGPADRLEDHELCLEMFKRSRDLANDFPSLRMPLMNTMDDKKSLPGESLTVRVAKAFSVEFMNYLQRTFC